MDNNESFNRISKEFAKNREELDDHRESINQNTNEIQSLYDYLYELDSKIDKMAERIDALTSALMPNPNPIPANSKLTQAEQEAFLHVYSSDRPLKVTDLARSLSVTMMQAADRIMQLRVKGVPILSSIIDGEQHLSLDVQFKSEQARKNVLNIPESKRMEMAKKIY